MKKILYVYEITNLINGKKYIGKHSSEKIENPYFGSGIAIKKAILKYGKNNFVKKVLCICDNEDELNKKEIEHISKANTFSHGYNMTKGGEGQLGYKQSPETIKKSSEGRKLYYRNNPEKRLIISERAKLRIGDKNPFFGKKLTKEHIEKMKVARVKAITGAKNPSARKIMCIETGEIFSMAKDAALFCGLAYSTSILKAAKGQIKSAGGYTWKLIN